MNKLNRKPVMANLEQLYEAAKGIGIFDAIELT